PERAVQYLRERGARLCFGTALTQFDDGGAVVGQDQRVQADAYVLGVTGDELARLVPEPWAAGAGELTRAAIVGLTVWYDGPIFEGQVLAAIVGGRPLWLFGRSRILRKGGPEHHVAVSISAAEAVMDEPRQELAGQVAAQLARALPAAREARLLHA